MNDRGAKTSHHSSSPLENLHPAYFAMVMATGIVSIACNLKGWTLLSYVLFWVNAPTYVLLWILSLTRAVLYPKRLFADMSDHARGVGFFTTIAGTCVLGSQCVVLFQAYTVAFVLWFLGLLLWVILIYSIFTLFTVRGEKPPLAVGLNGGWLVAIVATQSVSILGSQLSSQLESTKDAMLFFCLTMWLGGGMLYVWTISLIFYRYTFFPMRASDLSPPYWINMGAVAISTLAGAFLIAENDQASFLMSLLPFLKGVTLAFWATATWWIPMLLTLGAWRHLYMKFPLCYDPLYWGAVFPLGMYTACTYRLSETLDVVFLHPIPDYFIYVAVVAWMAVFWGLVHSLFRMLLPSRATSR
ncbi:MAG: tellurite resistance/C4-dicarboxylate transporter family protein [Candidatus Omnitrophica bacterium]|nr:tellurite resistance/C4-dicarboxylate transporter family protein [Candidatus Omnitrophota bacterium]